jgi:hypothetical protein
MRSLLRGAVLLFLVPGCVTVASSVYRSAPATPDSPPPPSGEAAPAAESGAAARWAELPVSGTRDPAGAVELAVVEVHGRRTVATLASLVDEFRRRVAEVGGDHARIDRFATKYEMVSEPYTYDCGQTRTEHQTRTVSRTDAQGRSYSQVETVPVTRHEPKTCFGTRQVEAATLTLTGRALRTPGGGKP